MNYTLHYTRLVQKARAANRKRYSTKNINYVYYENHHIIPKCMNGTNDGENLVLLTPEEHYLAHLLLIKIYPGVRGLTSAAIQMTRNKNRTNNKLYGWLRREHASNLVELHRQKSVGMHGKTHSAETKQKMSENNYYNNGGKQLTGEDNPNYRLKRSQETKDKISKIKTGSTHAPHTKETKQKMRESRKLQSRTRDMTISIDGTIFTSATNAAASLGITVSGLCRRMRTNKFPEYFYL